MLSNSQVSAKVSAAYDKARKSNDPMMSLSKYIGFLESQIKDAIFYLDDNGQSAMAKELMNNFDKFRP